jgi:hypothetical protein
MKRAKTKLMGREQFAGREYGCETLDDYLFKDLGE